jgi:hypothetical protein
MGGGLSFFSRFKNRVRVSVDYLYYDASPSEATSPKGLGLRVVAVFGFGVSAQVLCAKVVKRDDVASIMRLIHDRHPIQHRVRCLDLFNLIWFNLECFL